MLEKDMSLKKYNFFLMIVFTILFSQKNVFSKEIDITEIVKYLETLNNFSAQFIQADDITIEEGRVFVGKNRVRLDYYFES